MTAMTTTLTEHTFDESALFEKIANALTISKSQVASFAALYDEGASVPFIARYRKDKTGGLDDVVLRELEKALLDERDLAARRQKTIELLQAQNVAISDELAARIHAAKSKLELDEIYQPYRPKRRSLASKARLAGLQEATDKILAGANLDEALQDYQAVSTVTDETGESFEVDYSTRELQLAGIQAIIMDIWATDLALADDVRIAFGKTASIHALLASEEKREVGEKFKDYFDHSEPFAKLSGHRLLAMLRGRQQNVLVLKVQGEDAPFIDKIAHHFGATGSDERAQFLLDTAKKLWADKWRPQIEHRLLTEHRLKAENDAIQIFAKNLHHLLMAAPAGQKVILGVDPGIRHGVKMAVIDGTGEVLTTETVYPFGNEQAQAAAKQAIAKLITDHQVALVAIGNGTASRETENLIKTIIKDNQLSATALVISEAGASVYSASALASSELGNLDVSVRGAVSIARRLQDPLSELVKVEPKAIGVGQYQHDVNQTELESSLDKVTEDCVNAVGVDVNTASPSILSHIAGLNKNVAEQIVNYRRANGAFANREALKAVPRLGAKTFEQSAGFLRIKSGDEPLDATGVHPESYGLVYEMLAQHGLTVDEVIGNSTITDKLLQGVDKLSPLGSAIGELAKSRHDPRGEFKTVKFNEHINSISDLAIGMELDGVVTNVTAFGCFVDVGVHQDGLVHISELSDEFVANPNDVVKPFDIVKVRVINVDEARTRIGFSMKKQEKTDVSKNKSDKPKPDHNNKQNKSTKKPARTAKPTPSEQVSKIGSLGALLKQAGIK